MFRVKVGYGVFPAFLFVVLGTIALENIILLTYGLMGTDDGVFICYLDSVYRQNSGLLVQFVLWYKIKSVASQTKKQVTYKVGMEFSR